LAKIALEAHILGDPEIWDHAPLDLLAALSGSFARVEAREAFTTNLRPLPIGRLRPI
jgi:hypothetical protein